MLMELFSVLIYGLVQGVMEFFPISSSGHLALLPYFLKIKNPGLLFDLSMHVGTAFSVLVYFRQDCGRMLKSGYSTLALLKEHPKALFSLEGEKAFFFNLISATITSFLFILLLKALPFYEQARSIPWIAFNLAFFGALMMITDHFATKKKESTMHLFSFKRSCLIGLMQSLAIYPGVSRSGATLTMARLLGLSRTEGTEFSFFLSLPLFWADFYGRPPSFFQGPLPFDMFSCFLGVTLSFLVGLLSIHVFLKAINKFGLAPFALYRILLAMILIFLWG